MKHLLAADLWEAGVEHLLQQLNPWLQEHWQTALVASDSEPLYLPADASRPYHEIHFAHGYFNSALHELAHWCVAGEARRQLLDYGYWYAEDGRNADQQQQFEQVEVYPQAIEWHLALACGRTFRVSADNLSLPNYDTLPFAMRVYDKAISLRASGLSARTARLQQKLAEIYQTDLAKIEFVAPSR